MLFDQNRRGLAFALFAALLWASSAVLGKSLFALGMTPIALVQARCTLGAIALGAALALFDRRLFEIARRDLPLLALTGGLTLAATQTCYFHAVRDLYVAAAILLQYSSAFLVLAFSVAFLHERLTRPKAASLVLAVAGCFFVAGGYNIELARLNRAGITWGLFAAASFAAYTLLGARLMQRYHPCTVLFYALLFAAISLNTVASPFSFAPFLAESPNHAMKVSYVALFGTVAPFGLFFASVQLLGAPKAAIATMAEPVFSALIAYAALGEMFEPLQMVGAVAIISAVIVLERFREG
jgi:drug/metabolite transporter (DMT)-like permease